MHGVVWIFYLPTSALCPNSISDRRSTLDSMCLFPGVGLAVWPPETARQHADPFPCSLDSGLGHRMPKSLASLSQPCGSACFVSRVPVFDLDGFQSCAFVNVGGPKLRFRGHGTRHFCRSKTERVRLMFRPFAFEPQLPTKVMIPQQSR